MHVQFEFNGVPSEIQLNTKKNWEIKKQMDSNYHVLREQEVKRTLPHKEIEKLKRESRALAQDMDLDISDLTSFKVNSPVKGSDKSVLVRRSLEDLKGDQNLPLKSYSKETSSDADIAYNRPESLLNQKESLEGGKGNIDKPLLSSIQATQSPLKSQERPYRIITDKEAFIKNLDLSATATPIPKELDVKGFLKSLEGVENKENFIKHLQVKKDAQSRLAYLNLVEPTLKEWDIKLIFKDPPRQEYIKAFKKEGDKNVTYLLVTKNEDKLLVTGLPINKRYLKGKLNNADIIHAFIPPDSKNANALRGLSDTSIINNSIKSQDSQPLTVAERLNSPLDLKLPFVAESNKINEDIMIPYYTKGLNGLKKLIGHRIMAVQEPKAYYNKDIGFIDLVAGIRNSDLYKIEVEAKQYPLIQELFQNIDKQYGIYDERGIWKKHEQLALLIDKALNGKLKKVNNITAVLEAPYSYNNKTYKLQAEVRYTQQADRLNTGRWVLRDFRCVE
ncbi:hypothetical protein [Helicobacter suis]|uniref:hypothetical protein n=1 Tax=Helicobacter suis TaxID=104628 RepID=UPI0013D65893|nr:hypothetical protein [Helicobacter suis]